MSPRWILGAILVVSCARNGERPPLAAVSCDRAVTTEERTQCPEMTVTRSQILGESRPAVGEATLTSAKEEKKSPVPVEAAAQPAPPPPPARPPAPPVRPAPPRPRPPQ